MLNFKIGRIERNEIFVKFSSQKKFPKFLRKYFSPAEICNFRKTLMPKFKTEN